VDISNKTMTAVFQKELSLNRHYHPSISKSVARPAKDIRDLARNLIARVLKRASARYFLSSEHSASESQQITDSETAIVLAYLKGLLTEYNGIEYFWISF